MTERKRGLTPLDRDVVMQAIAPQIDKLIEFGFHRTTANDAYRDALEEESGYSSILEARFRTQLQNVSYPEFVEDPMNLYLVIPNLTTRTQASLLGIGNEEYFEPNVYADKDLPQEPYVVEITPGDLKSSPRATARKMLGIIDAALNPDPAGSLNKLAEGFEKKGLRGLSIHEMLAYTRENPDISRVHALKRRVMRPSTVTGEQELVYLTVAKGDTRFFCASAGLSHVPRSMEEVPHTRKNTRFVGGVPQR
jgi:hypothetical protein